MMLKIKLLLILFFTHFIYADALLVEDKTDFVELLPSSLIYIDHSRKLTIKDITTQNIMFEKNDKRLLGFGYSPDFDVWIKFTLKNNSHKTVHKILEYANSMTTQVKFYDIDSNIVTTEGLLHTKSNRSSINPIFKLTLQPYQTKTYYMKASSYITTLIVNLKLFNDDVFYKKELKHQFILALFFGSMLILAVYNLFIYFFTKDKSYLFYVLYIFGIAVHHTLYVGVANVYILNNISMYYVVQFASLFIAFPIFFLALFSKSFLQIANYPILNKILNILLILFPLSLLLFIFTDMFNQYRNIFSILVLLFLIAIAGYLAYKRNRQAYFIIAGWIILAIGGFVMYLSSTGIINIYKSFPYIVETSLLCEAILFSIALSDKINKLQNKLITQKKTENERLEIQVVEKTKDLNISLGEKTLLLKELNHRVKNNMQMIVSLIRLQINDIEDKKIKNLFVATENRLNTMSQLHELLYQKDDGTSVNTYEYFSTLIEGLQETYTQDINVNYKININLQTDQAASCGIILNELVTNSFKYAFVDNTGDIDIYLSKENNKNILTIKDNGVGYDPNKMKKSFGLVLVTTLVESKLQGTLTTSTTNGVNIQIEWSEDE
jgi:two-component sensor histidine kinase